MLSATASRDAAGKVHVSLINLDPRNDMALDLRLPGLKATQVSGRILTATAMNAHNTFDQPEQVQPQVFSGANLHANRLDLQLPAKSILTLELR